MLNCCIFCMNLPLLIFQQAFCCPILKQWSWKLAVGSLFIFSLQHPGFCNLTSTHGIWQGVLLVNLERQSDCWRTVVELRYQCGRSACQRPQLTDGAPLKYCQLLLLLKLPWGSPAETHYVKFVEIWIHSVWKIGIFLTIFTECQLKSPRTTFWQW